MGHAIDEDGQFLRWPGKVNLFLVISLKRENIVTYIPLKYQAISIAPVKYHIINLLELRD